MSMAGTFSQSVPTIDPPSPRPPVCALAGEAVFKVACIAEPHLQERLSDQAQARAIYTPFFGVIRVAYPKA